MKVVGVIPARWGSTRFEGKVLAEIKGKPMLQHVWQRVLKASKLDEVIIACDDERIKIACEQFEANVVMTSPEHESGTDRIAEAVENLEADIVINIQGDEPLIDPEIIDRLIDVMHENANEKLATVIKKFDDNMDISDPNIVKVVIDSNKYALYFSRCAIPYNRDGIKVDSYKHLGIYAYRKQFLLEFANMEKSKLEQAECLEQLRALESGVKIKTIETDKDTCGVDTPEDLEKVEGLLS